MSTSSLVPDRYQHAVVAHLMVAGADQALRFYATAFGARELFRIATPDGRVVHAETVIEDSLFMVGDADGPFAAPGLHSGTSVALHVHVADVEACHARAVEHGATSVQPVQAMFYGARSAMVRDPFGHVWVLLTYTEDLDPAVIAQRGNALLAGVSGQGAAPAGA